MRRVAGIRAVLLGLLLVFAVFAQRDLGTIAGTVTDPTGAAIPNAKITITEVATNESYTLTSNSSGEYGAEAGHLHGGGRSARISPGRSGECAGHRRRPHRRPADAAGR